MTLDATNWQIYRRLLKYLKPLKWLFMLSLLGNAIYAGASALMAKSMDYLVNAIQSPTEESRIFVPLIIIGVFFMRGIGAFLGTFFIAKVGASIVHEIRQEVFFRYLRLPSRFYDANNAGHLVSKLTFNASQVTGAATDAVTVSVREGLTVVGLMSVMFYENWRLTLIFLSVGPLIGLVVGSVSKRFRKLSQRIMNSMGDVTHVASEALSGYRVVRIFGGEAYEKDRFRVASLNNLNQSLKMELTKAASTPVVQVLISVSIAILVWLALAPEVQGDMSAGSFIAFITAATTMAKPIRQLTQVNATIQRGVAAAKDLFSVLDLDAEADSGKLEVSRVRGELELRHLFFRYTAESNWVLKDVNVKIPAGSTVALVGRSGSGKSTLASLIPRFYEPTQGEILLDGQRLDNYALHSLRDQISLVTQQVTLFNDTIKRNIAYGVLADLDDNRIEDAARKAYALSFIEQLPQGMETEVGDNGVLLSGGQRQRLAIARALLKDSPILIFDEATSALDTESERHIQDAMDAVMRGRTTLVIAHRLSTIENADLILVMDEGRIIESGTHRELLMAGGLYSQLHRMQFSE
ncbi:MAG: lipid A export permease/ATP-binding protein MsbA [Hahellaceae bacterium]|nr:lipid A export permease/ATP-binding protein MsbA [Hahellaceae bacterium]